MANNDDYEVGYGKPPENTRFQPGESGNKKGRPKGSGNFFKDLDRLLRSKVTINKDGMGRKISTQEAALLRLGEKALKGDARALIHFLELAQRRSEEHGAQSAERQLTSEGAAILERFKADILKAASAESEKAKGDRSDGKG